MDLHTILATAAHGLDLHLDAQDVALAVPRVAVGVFFGISGFHKLFVPARHASLTANLTKNGIPHVKFMQWWVPFWEFTAGAMLALGLLSAFSAMVLIIISAVAFCCEGPSRIAAYKPINKADALDDALYLQETLYVIMLMVTILAGPGKFSIDYLIF